MAIRDDLAAKEPQTFGTLTHVEPSDDDAGGALVAELGSVTDDGKTHPSGFDPANAWRLRVSVSIGVQPAKTTSEVWYATTRSGRTIAARYHFASADLQLRTRVRSVVEARLHQLLATVPELD